MTIRRAWTFALSTAVLAGPAWGFNQPPANLSATTFLDGGAPPGLYYLNYSIFTDGRRAVDKDGKTIDGGAQVDAFAQLHQLYYVADRKLLGAKLALDLLVPLVAVTAKGSLGAAPVTANTAGMGDLLAGLALQWDEASLLGRPLLQRFESDVTMPTGKYDKNFAANPGSNLWTTESYYSFVWFFAEKWETSLRLWHAYHTENPDTKVQPGQRAHFSWAVSRQVLPKLRLGAAGYALRQLADDKVAGVRQSDSRERVFAAGPGLVYQGGGLTAMLSHPVEFWGQNRFVGSRTTLQLIHRF
ncbi:MAG: transporter [Elusimicrobia bacterium]|nr:transporter [Elusimicrobiota bacterium]